MSLHFGITKLSIQRPTKDHKKENVFKKDFWMSTPKLRLNLWHKYAKTYAPVTRESESSTSKYDTKKVNGAHTEPDDVIVD